MIVAETEDYAPFGPEYQIYRGRTKADTVVRHYVGIPAIRPRYYLEGVPLLLEQAKSFQTSVRPF